MWKDKLQHTKGLPIPYQYGYCCHHVNIFYPPPNGYLNYFLYREQKLISIANYQKRVGCYCGGGVCIGGGCYSCRHSICMVVWVMVLTVVSAVVVSLLILPIMIPIYAFISVPVFIYFFLLFLSLRKEGGKEEK